MEFTHDPDVNAAYIRVWPSKLRGVQTVVVTRDLNIDLTPDGEQLYGIELLDAARQIPLFQELAATIVAGPTER